MTQSFGRLRMPHCMVVLGFVSMLMAWLVAIPAQAQSKRAVVMSFEGPRNARVRSAVLESLGDRVALVSTRDAEAAASRIGASTSSAEGRVGVARELQVDAWIGGRVTRSGRNWVLVLSVASGQSGELAEVAELQGRDPQTLAKRVQAQAHTELSSALAQAERPEALREPEPEPEPEPVARRAEAAPDEDEDEDEAQPEPADDDDGERPMALALELGVGGFSRDFSYRENLSALPTYDVAFPPIGWVGLQWFPGAHFSSGALAHVGLRAQGALAFGLSSKVEAGGDAEFATRSSLIEVGLRGRLPLSALQLAADISYGSHVYGIDAADTSQGVIDPGIPSASYRYLRFHVDATLALGEVASLGIGAGVLPLLSLGEVETWFPNAGGLALEGSVHFAYALVSFLDVVVSVTARRYAVTLDPSVQDVQAGNPIAAGYVDQYVVGQLGLRLRLGGTP